jgi:autotransporter strand-loop-strand O-heptosyltransferase
MKTILIQLYSNSLGDTISIMPCVEYFISKTQDNVVLKVNPRFHFLFINSYPTIKFYQENEHFDKKIELHYNFNLPLQTGFAQQLGFIDWTYVRPKVDITIKERPIKSKYVSISIHSTSQLKYWNHPSGKESQPTSPYWTELNGLLRKSGYTPVVVERDEMFGKSPFMNGMPSKSNNKIGLNLEDTINHIYHSEFFIGLSSGLSWLAHAMGKKVVMISNFSDENHEFDLSCDDYKRITNKSVCNNCWGQVNKEFKFESSDWYWCPKHKDTPRQFECHTSITPEYVFEQIKDWLN